ncbi:MAG: hypothetical protein K0Q55_2201 [Verrucomicrobia bacterium]|jgi:hypothetical protein|nr:hypothetical protein [Verrucomicrobiota bacterium]
MGALGFGGGGVWLLWCLGGKGQGSSVAPMAT